MLNEALPSTLDVRKAAARGARVRGFLRPVDLQRFRSLLAEDTGKIEAELSFSRDEENRFLVSLQVRAEVVVTCQRCLGQLPITLDSDNILAVVWTDEQAAHLPRSLEPLIVEEEACQLWSVVEDELILALPAFNYHDTAECQEILASFNRQAVPAESVSAEDKPNPFSVLAQLKPGGNN